MRIGDAGVDFLDAADRQDVARGLAAELVSTVAGANGNGQGVQARGFDKLGGFFGVGQHLAVVQLAFGANAVFFSGFASFQIAQATKFSFNRHTECMCHVDDAAGDVDVVAKVGGSFAVLVQGAVHHHRGKTQVDGALAHRRALTVVLVHDQRNVRPLLHGGLDQMLDEGLARVFASARAGLQDDRRTDLVSRGHHRLDLLEVVDVESRDAIAVHRGMVEQFTH